MITVYLKPTNYCNVGCEHCYLPEGVRADRDRMTFATLARTAEMLRDMADKERHDSVHVIWHGGEPMVLSPEWFWQAGEILDAMLPGHTESIQTSLIPYTRDYADLVRDRFQSEIGSSIDFSSRKIKGSNAAYLDLWMQKVGMARDDGLLVIPGVVPSRNELLRARDIVKWFVDNGFERFNFERFNSFGQSLPDCPSNKEHSLFLIDLFDDLMERMSLDSRAPAVMAIAAGIGGVLHGTPGDRWGGRCQSDFVVIEPNGSLNNCPDKASFEPSFGNVYSGFDVFSSSALRRKWIRIQALDHKKSHCQTCEYSSWCKSGCPITLNGLEDGEGECSGYKTFLRHVQSYINTAQGRKVANDYLYKTFNPARAVC